MFGKNTISHLGKPSLLIIITILTTTAVWIGAMGPTNPPANNTPTPLTVLGGSKTGALGVGGNPPQPETITIGGITHTVSTINLEVTGDGIDNEGFVSINGGFVSESLITGGGIYTGHIITGNESVADIEGDLNAGEYIAVQNLAHDFSVFNPFSDVDPFVPRAICATAEGYLVPCE